MLWVGVKIFCGMTVTRMEMLQVSVRKMKALPVKVGTVTSIKDGNVRSECEEDEGTDYEDGH
jgi:hypothetical protein